MNTLVLGAGGFIGHHLVNRLKAAGHTVVGVDLKYPEFAPTTADWFHLTDLAEERHVEALFASYKPFDEVYQLAADMGGAGYIFTGAHDADIMHNSASINLNVAKWACKNNAGKLFYSSSACIYPANIQEAPNHPGLKEDMADLGVPDSNYGVEKRFSENLYLSFAKNYGLNVRIARFHNIFGPEGTYTGGREKAPAAVCRKVASAPDGGEIEVWGDGEQTRSFLYITDCLDGVAALMASDFIGPVNIGSEEQVTINQLANMAITLSGKQLGIKHIDGPLGVRGRNSDNQLVKAKTGWLPAKSLLEGMTPTYAWVKEMVARNGV